VVTVQLPAPHHLRRPGWLRVVRPTCSFQAFVVQEVRVAGRGASVVQAWHESSADVGLSTVLDAVRRRVVTADTIADAANDRARIRARAQLMRVLALTRDGVTSYLEHHARTTVFTRVRCPELRWQVPIVARGRRYVLDAFEPDARLALEFDGTASHGNDAQRRADLERDAHLAGEGIDTIRFTYEDLMQRPEWCMSIYRAARARRLQHPLAR